MDSEDTKLGKSFAWLNATQFLGALNDNIFKLLMIAARNWGPVFKPVLPAELYHDYNFIFTDCHPDSGFFFKKFQNPGYIISEIILF